MDVKEVSLKPFTDQKPGKQALFMTRQCTPPALTEIRYIWTSKEGHRLPTTTLFGILHYFNSTLNPGGS